MFSVGVKAGRLLEIRLVAPVTMESVEGTGKLLLQCFQKHPGKLIAVTDITRATVFPQDVAAPRTEVFKVDNPRIERSGILVSDGAVFSLQIERLMAAAEHPHRRCFHDAAHLKNLDVS